MITAARYSQDGFVIATIDGKEWSGITGGSRFWADIEAWVAEGNAIEPYIPEPGPELTKIYKSEIWRRATDAEAVTIKAGLLQQPVRLQELWSSVSYISTADELYTALRAGFVAAFGEARTNELLEATE